VRAKGWSSVKPLFPPGHRTAEQVHEEEVLMAELRKIQLRKKERERKQQDLQKLISAAEQNTDRLFNC